MRLHGGLLRRKINRALLRSSLHKRSAHPVRLHNKNSSMVMGWEEDRVLSTGYSRVSLSPWGSPLTSLPRPPRESRTQLATVIPGVGASHERQFSQLRDNETGPLPANACSSWAYKFIDALQYDQYAICVCVGGVVVLQLLKSSIKWIKYDL